MSRLPGDDAKGEGELGITLVGYVRGSRFNVYTHPTRIAAASADKNRNSKLTDTWQEEPGETNGGTVDTHVPPAPSPHFSPAFYCGGGYEHVYCVALGRAPRRSVNYASGALWSRAL
jgi:hypothetical protein